MGTFAFSELPRNLQRLNATAIRNLNRIVGRASTTLVREVVLDTPVDTGRARSNWVGTLDAPFTGQLPPYSPLAQGKDPGKKFEANNAAAAISQSKAAISRFDVRKNRAFYVSNGVKDPKTGRSYIGELNAGGSPQTRAGFVQRSFQKARISITGMGLLDK